MNAVKFNDVWEMYKIKFIIEGKTTWENFWALKGVSLSIGEGENVGIIGENGAGKSTILKLIMGMLRPDRGGIEVSGRVSGLLELGAGFQAELTGKENIYLNAGLFGLTQGQTEERYSEIVNFASLGKFIHAPVKCYSQGMFVRLAFAIAIHVDPGVLLIDDTLAVGDEYFQRKCIKKIFELKEQGKTIVFVTHDMNMLRRLCKRAIFLKDGRIVKDGLSDTVIPLYTQMIGERQGVGILEKGPLNLVFNNGRIFLNWQGKLITPNSGAYTSFLISDKWYSSLQADWHVEKSSENELLVAGKFYQLALAQAWRLEIADDGVKWDIAISSDEPLEIQEGCVNVMLTDEYTNWFTALEKGKFAPISYKDKNWQSVLSGNISTGCIGVEAKENSNNKIPSLVFKQSSYAYAASAQILNADYLTNCRVLQYKILGLQNYSAAQANKLVYFSGRILLDIPDIDKYLQNLEDEFVLSNGNSRLTFDNGRCILDYNGITLTKASHISTSIFVNQRWYSSNLAHWDFKKEGKNKLIACGNWPCLALTQIWEIEIIGEGCFLWKVSMQVNEELDIEQQHFSIMGCKDYTSWFSKYGRGKFPGSFLETDIDMVQRCIPEGEIGLMDQNTKLPALRLRFSNEFHNFAKIFNSDFYCKARILRVEKIEPEKNIKFSPGRYPCFELGVALDKDKDNQACATELGALQEKKLKFIFKNGSGRIFWKEQELTKRLGLYTSLRSEGRWHDSASSAIWKIEKNDGTIKALGEWLHLPVKQIWEISLQNEAAIEFNISLKVGGKIEVDRLQTNLMVSEIYSEWINGKGKSPFPLFKEDVDDDWDVIYSEKDGIKYIGVAEAIEGKFFLPSLKLSPQGLDRDYCFNILNSDIYHRGRVLQYSNKDKKFLLPGEYLYYKGEILIEKF